MRSWVQVEAKALLLEHLQGYMSKNVRQFDRSVLQSINLLFA
jgi:hypothetical protein